MALWREQYDRMRRWHRRLWLGVEHIVGGSDEAAIDAFYAFAQTCYHLVDWLENDRSQHIRRSQADAHVAASPALSFCRDICNGSKHARLEEKEVRFKIEKTTESFHVSDDDDDIVVVQPHLFVEWEGGQYVEVGQFAGRCIEEWTRLLESEGLGPGLKALASL